MRKPKIRLELYGKRHTKRISDNIDVSKLKKKQYSLYLLKTTTRLCKVSWSVNSKMLARLYKRPPQTEAINEAYAD